MRRFSLSGIRVRLLLLVLLAVLPALGLILYRGLEERRAAAADAHEDALRLARLASRDYEDLVVGARQLLAVLSQLPSVQAGDPALCGRLFPRLLKQFPQYTGLAVVRANGDLLCSVPPVHRALNFSDRSWYRRLVETHEFAIGEYQLGRISGKPNVVFAHPVLDRTEKLQAIATAGLDLAWLTRFAAEATLPPGSAVIVTDRNGTVLGRFPEPERWVGKLFPEAIFVQAILEEQGKVSVALRGVDGVRRLYSFVPLGDGGKAGAALAVGIPATIAFARADRRLVIGLAGMAGVAVLALVVAWVCGHLVLVRPIDAMLRATRRLRDGDLGARVGGPYGQGELGQLAASFDDMAGALERHRAEREQAAEALRRSEELFRRTFDQSPIGAAIVGLDSRYQRVNAALCRITGYTAEELMSRSFGDITHPHDAGTDEEGNRRLLAGEIEQYQRDKRYIRKDGEIVWVHLSVRLARDGAGRPLYFLPMTEDITEHKRAEDALRASEERFRLLVQSVQEYAIVTLDPEGRVTTWNPGAERIKGYAPDEIVGSSFHRFYTDADRANGKPESLLKAAASQGQVTDSGWRVRSDGSRFWADVVMAALRDESGRLKGFVKVTRDLTERRRLEEQLREALDFTRTVIESSPVGITAYRGTGECVLTNAAAARIVGATTEDLLRQNFRRIASWRASGLLEAAEEALATGAEGRREVHVTTTFGKDVWVACTFGAFAREGQTHLLLIMEDITQRKRAEARAEARLSRLHLLNQITRAIGERQDVPSIVRVTLAYLQEHLPVHYGCVCEFDSRGDSMTVLAGGDAGRPPAEGPGFLPGSSLPVEEIGLQELLAGATVSVPDTVQSSSPFLGRFAAAGFRSVAATPLFVESGVAGLLVVARQDADAFSSGDCEFLRMLGEQLGLAVHQAQLYTQLEKAYQDLRQTQQVVTQQERLRALGQMASGVAHDINNALSPAALYTESLLESDPSLGERAREQLTIVQRALHDVSQTIDRMREFYRPREPQVAPQTVNLNRVVSQVVELTRPRWEDVPQERGVVIRLETDLQADVPPILGMEGEIREALTNLVFNAVDAMPQGGTLTLRVRAEGPERQKSRGAEEQGGSGEPEGTARAPLPPSASAPPQVVLEVADTGVGMDAETSRRCLEPFFTTKGERGTGLGLAMVYGMVQRHQGEIAIESREGQGTTVRLYFPLRGAGLELELPEAAAGRLRALRILVVDDDALLRQSLRDTLGAEGHTVSVADGGGEGIEAFRAARAEGAPFDVVITDLGMPRVSGREVARAVKAASPGTPVILLTGWGARMVSENDIPAQVDRVLSKPPKLRELREALAAVAP